MKLSQAVSLADEVTIDRWTYVAAQDEITVSDLPDGEQQFDFKGDEDRVVFKDQELQPALPDKQAYWAIDIGGTYRRMYFWKVETTAITAETIGE